MFCAGSITGGQGTCEVNKKQLLVSFEENQKGNSKFQFDEGGGLMCNNLVHGVVSRAGCSLANFPTVYTDVAVYNTWIDSILNWDSGEHENVPTPTSITEATTVEPTTPTPDGASAVVKSLYLFVFCTTLLLFR